MDKKAEFRRPVLAQAVEDNLLMGNQIGSEATSRSAGVVGFEQAPVLRPMPKPQSRLVCFDVHEPATLEFGLLAARLNKFKAQNRMKRVLVAGCGFRSGGSLISANLAIMLAQDRSQRVLLVDADLERSSLSELFGVRTEKGLSDHLQSGEPVENLVCQLGPRQNMVPARWTSPRNNNGQGQIYQSQRLASLLHLETDWFDWVVVDPPSLETWLASRAVAQLCDGIIIVVRRGYTEKKTLRRALDLLEGLPLLGVAWND